MKLKRKNTFLTNKEWAKDIKFNNHWYHLTALFDRGVESKYNFNREINDLDRNYLRIGKKTKKKMRANKEEDLFLNDSPKFDFNSELSEIVDLDKYYDDNSIYIKKRNVSSELKHEAEEDIKHLAKNGVNLQLVIEKLLHVSCLKFNNSRFLISRDENDTPILTCKYVTYTDAIYLKEILSKNGWLLFENNIDIKEYTGYDQSFIDSCFISPDEGCVLIILNDRTGILKTTGKVLYRDCFEESINVKNIPSYKLAVKTLRHYELSNPYEYGFLFKEDQNQRGYFETSFLHSEDGEGTFVVKSIINAWQINANILINEDKIKKKLEEKNIKINKENYQEGLMTVDGAIHVYSYLEGDKIVVRIDIN